MPKTISKNQTQKFLTPTIKRDLNAWRGLAGIWKGKKLPNPIQWQRKIRKNWERKLP